MKKLTAFKELMRWKKKHLKHGFLSKKDGETLQKMAIAEYMKETINRIQFDNLITETMISGNIFSYVLDEIRLIYPTINRAFKQYDQQRR